MDLIDMYDFSQIENEAEKLVIKEIEKQIPEEDYEDNEEFVLDIATYALNQIKPAYSYTLMGRVYSKSLEDNTEYHKHIEKMVKEAIKKIRKNPS